jgi:hypothetical protein
MGALNGLRTATLDEVIIKRNGEYADIRYKDKPFVGGMNLGLGECTDDLSDDEILSCFNEVVLSMQASVASFCPLEIQPGYPQIKFDRKWKRWDTLGQVLRCEIEDDENGQVAISIDDHKLNPDQFITMISSFRGWGMRIEFMDESQLFEPPPVVVRKRPAKVKL